MIRALFILLSTLILSACAMGGIATISEPSFEQTSARKLDERGVLWQDNLSVSIVPDNAYGNIGGIGLIIPIIPISASLKSPRDGQPFEIEVRFETTVSGYTFSPLEVELHYRNDVFLPVRATPFIKQTFETRSEGRSVPGHSWACGRPIQWYGSERIGESVSLSKGCVELEFPISTIRPQDQFSVSLKGVRFNGQTVSMPLMEFKKSIRGIYVIMGGP